ncbi:protein CTR9 homolog isoform X3 [Durio zibethinus]|uniref:Protein CTR9 homolog isoform X3 n=1 Tax=Durio zibethinus TaxID=66656 RepID=A0A6P5ZPU7_DURZI|nr:protein CTR9 homolog isoform X3 [Durio zibethinus]
MACVYIPVQNSEEEVRVALDQLPRDASDILDILKAEQAPLDLWLIIAREYFKQGKIEQFRQILEEGSSPEIDEYYADVRYERIAILNALGAYYSYLGKIETKQREKEEHFILATQYYNKASRIDMHEPSTWVGKGQLLLAKGEVEQAFAAFKIVLEGDRDNVPALLGQACVEFNRGRYSDSLELYKRALQVYPNCPGAVRLGIGLCRYKLGQFEKARQAFQRVLQLDSENVEALVALAIMDLQANDAAGIQKGMGQMRRAFEIYPYCAMALNYLANHFFFTGQHFLVEQLTETALAVTNHGPTKSHSYYNLARSYHSKGDYEKAGFYYMASIKEINKPHEFIFPYYGLGQVKLKSGDFRSALSNFEKVLEVYPDNSETLKALGHIYVQLGQVEKALEFMKKATKIDPRDAQAFLDLGELLISFDTGAALDAFKTARNLLEKGGQAVPVEVLNNIGVIHFEREELELALESFNKAVGDGVWHALTGNKPKSYIIEAMASILDYKDMQLFHRLEEDGLSVELPWNKVTVVFNLARLHEQLHNTGTANLLYRLILFKGNWNYFAAIRNEKRNPKLEATHLEKAKELYTRVLVQHTDNLYAANGAGVVLAEKGQFDVSKDIFTQVQEGASGSVFVQMPDVWINLAHIFFAQGNFALAVKMYQNCLRKFYHNTDSQILLYLARTHYEAEQWQECKKTLLRAIHLAPSNYTLRFDAGVAMQKFSTSTLQKEKRTADEVRSTVAELENAVRIFSQLSAASNLHLHGFDEKKINTHVEYCKHLLDAAKVHREAAEREEQQNRQKQEAARQLALAEEARRKAEEQRKFLLERRKQEDEQKRLQQAEEHFKRVQEQWKSSIPASKRRERSEIDDEEGGHSEKRRRKGGKRRKKDKKKTRYDRDDEEPDMMDDREELEDEDANMNYRESTTQMNDQDDENTGENAQDLLAAAGLEDSDVEDEPVAPSSAAGRRRQAWSESDDDEPLQRGPESSPARENSAELQESDGEIREDNSKLNGAAALDDEED